MSELELRLFPLAGVLFPGGTLRLRIFEPRYLDLVRECAREDSAFGVSLILQGEEVGAPALPAAVGTLARISDFCTLPDGLLGITARGGERFRVVRTRVRHDGLVCATVQPWPAEPVLVVPPQFALLATILERLADKAGGALGHAERACFDDAGWVGFRLAEVLPLAPSERQQLLEMTDPLARLDHLQRGLARFLPE